MAKKRGQNEGTIYKRPNGTWCAQVTIDGRRLSKYAKTQRECREWLKETLPRIDQGLTVDGSRAKLGAYLQHWLETNRAGWAPNTIRAYSQVVRDHLAPNLGNLTLEKLRPDHIQRLYGKLSEQGLEATTIKLVHCVLRRALNQAVEWGLLVSSPTRGVQLPQIKRREMSVWDADQVRTFLATCQSHRLHALFHLAVTTGLRQGELLGLQWTDLDWDSGSLRIQRQLSRIRPGGGVQLRELKTDASRRSIILGERTVAVLRDHKRLQLEERLRYGNQWSDSSQNLMFINAKGRPVDPANMVTSFRALVGTTDLPRIRFHDLRHTAATLMLSQGIHPKIVQERLGHTNISMTLDIYSHVVPSMQREAADAMDRLVTATLLQPEKNLHKRRT